MGLFKKKPRLEDEIYPNMAILQIIILKRNKEDVFQKYGELEGALPLFNKEITKDQNNLISLVGKAFILGERGKHKEALIFYDKALEMTTKAKILFNSELIALSHNDAELIRGIVKAKYDLFARFRNELPPIIFKTGKPPLAIGESYLVTEIENFILDNNKK